VTKSPYRSNKERALGNFRKGVKVSLVFVFGVLFFFTLCVKDTNAVWNKSYIIDDNVFIRSSTMTQTQIQAFLVSKHSYLAGYKETRSNKIGTPERLQAKGKSASYIIKWVATEYGINPQVILITLQKEQSLVTNTGKNQYGLDWAMGYGVPDSGGRDYNKRGFSRQVDWGVWQLKYNYLGANNTPAEKFTKATCANVSPYCKGRTITIDGVRTYLGNGSTASLYRYTPHFHGNQNFDYFYSLWFHPYGYSFVSAKRPPSWMNPGQIVSTEIKIKNTGATTWKNDSQGTGTPMRLAITNGSGFYTTSGGMWLNSTRIKMTTATVTPGQTATFSFNIKAPQTAGAYIIKMVPVITNIRSLGYKGMYFRVSVRGKVPTYQFWSNKYGDHYYTASLTKKQQMINNYPDSVWNYQGVAFRSYNAAVNSATPVYQFWSNKYGDHYYTISKTKRDYLISKYPDSVWEYQGVAFYANKASVIGSAPVYQFWSNKYGDHYYTISKTKRDYLISKYPDSVWEYEGIAFYVPNS